MADSSTGAAGDGARAVGQSSSTAAVIEVSSFAKYIRRAVTVLFEDAEDTPEAINVALKDRTAMECMKKFLSDPQIRVLLVQRSDENEEGTETVFSITSEVKFSGLMVHNVVFIKRGLLVEADKDFSSQLNMINLNGGSPYEMFHAIVSSTFAPYCESYVRATGKVDRDGDKMASSVKKNIEELEMGLLYLQQNVDIPEITLTIHPMVSAVVKKCQEEGRRVKISDFRDKIDDLTFLNNLHSGVHRWIREIRKVTKLDRDPSFGSALQEISFWLSLERALLRIQKKRKSTEILVTLGILLHRERFPAAASFDMDSGLSQALETVHNYNLLMTDFPLNDLLSATELEHIQGALITIFAHLKKISATKYPVMRALRLVEAISRDFSTRLLKVLGTRRLMHIMFEDFEKVMVLCFEIFTAWSDKCITLQLLLGDILRKQEEKDPFMVWSVNPVHKHLQARVDQIRKFRRQHEQLRQAIIRVLRPAAVTNVPASTMVAEAEQLKEPLDLDAADANSVKEVDMAYDNVKEVDCLDVSKEGTDAWEAACKRYDERIDHVETRITAHLRDQLGTAKNANEMFRILSRFKALFAVRPRMRGAIRKYQTQLIQRVKDDIESLDEKFKIPYLQSKACHLSRVRDLPPVSGSIIWARQIERQLNACMQRVEDVLGKGWENHVEWQKLKADGDSFRAKLNTQQLFEDWSARAHNEPFARGDRIFGIESARSRQASKGNILRLKVNFAPEILTLIKEVRHLEGLGYRVPLAIVEKAHWANTYRPFAISLIGSVRTYERTCDKLEDRQSIVLLVAGMRHQMQSLITKGVVITWHSKSLYHYVHLMAKVICMFEEKVDHLLLVEEQIDLEVKMLNTCAYSHNTLSEVLARIQKHVDDLSLHHQYSNFLQWVSHLDQQVEMRLAARLEAGLKAWRQALEQETREKVDQDMNNLDTDAPVQLTHKPEGGPKLKKFIHELRITDQVMYLSPPIEEDRENILSELFSWEAIIIALPRITHAKCQVGVDAASVSEAHYKNLLTKLPGGQDALRGAYEMIEKTVRDIDGYVRVWLEYQSLWDLQADYLYGKLGNSIPKWMKALEGIKSSRKTFDTSETSKDFGPIKIEFGKVQSQVSLKYDSWHKEVLGKFGNMLGTEMKEFYGQISKSRGDLEQQSIETLNMSEAVGFITYVQSLKRKMKSWEKQVETYKEGQRILERQQFQFPTSWLYSDNVEGEWGAFSEIIRRKEASIQTQVASLQMKIVREDKVVEEKTTDLLSEWDKEKPVEDDIKELRERMVNHRDSD